MKLQREIVRHDCSFGIVDACECDICTEWTVLSECTPYFGGNIMCCRSCSREIEISKAALVSDAQAILLGTPFLSIKPEPNTHHEAKQ